MDLPAMRWKVQPITGSVSVCVCVCPERPIQTAGFRFPVVLPVHPHFYFSVQVSCRGISATACWAAWRRSSMNDAPATGIVVMMVNQCVGQMGSFIRTSVRWRFLPVETEPVSSRSQCPSVHMVRINCSWVHESLIVLPSLSQPEHIVG